MQIEKIQQTDSTNRELMRRLQTGALDTPTVLWTDRQTAGRGQRGRAWETPPGEALAFSAYFAHADLSVERIYQLNKWVSLAVCALLSADLPVADFRIKWPNDILVGGQKIAGILIENLLSGRQVTGSIIGVGLNLNQRTFSGDYRRSPVSLRQLTGENHDIAQVAESLASILALSYQSVFEDDGLLNTQYREQLYLYQQPADFRLAHKLLFGRILDVDAQGRLVVESEGEQLYFAHGEIEFLT